MARKPRIEYPGAVYHVMSRGNHQEAIFRDDPDRLRFLQCVEEACAKTGWRVHAYVLMNNHYHLLLETPEANLVVGMKWLQGTYTQRFNARHKTHGHLLQGRYKAVLVEPVETTHFQIVSTYIHLNPVRAKLIRAGQEPLRSFPWSSYPAYLLPPRKRPAWLRVERVLASLGFTADDAHARRGYEAYLEGRVVEWLSESSRKNLDADWQQIRQGWYLGTATFREQLLGHLDRLLQGRLPASFAGAAVRAKSEHEAEQWLHKALTALAMEPTQLQSLPKGATAKLVLAWWLWQRTTLPRAWIAQRLCLGHETRVTLAVRQVETAKSGPLAQMRRVIEWVGPSA